MIAVNASIANRVYLLIPNLPKRQTRRVCMPSPLRNAKRQNHPSKPPTSLSSIPSSLLLLLPLPVSAPGLLLLEFAAPPLFGGLLLCGSDGICIPNTGVLLPSPRLCISTAPFSSFFLKLHPLNNPPSLPLLANAAGAVCTAGGASSINPPTSCKNTAAPPVFAESSSAPDTGAGKLSNGDALRRLCAFVIVIVDPLRDGAGPARLPRRDSCGSVRLLVAGSGDSGPRRPPTSKKLSSWRVDGTWRGS